MADGDRADFDVAPKIALMWLVQAQFAGYVLAQQKFPGLKLIPRDLATSPLEPLARGQAEFGIVSPDQMLANVEAARRLVFIGLFMDRCPVVLIGLRGKAPENLARLRACRIGVWPGEDTEVRAMVDAAGGDVTGVTFEPLGASLTPLLDGTLDLIEATTYNELPHLERELGAEALVVHRPSLWDVDLAKDGLVVRADVLAAQPKLVDDVVATVVAGWREALHDPEGAVRAVLEADPTLDRDEQRDQLGWIFDLIDPRRPLGLPDSGAVERAVKVHRALGHAVSETDIAIDAGPWERARVE